MTRKRDAQEITDREIIRLYEEILPLLYDNPARIDVGQRINERLSLFVHYDSLHFLMDGLTGEAESPKINTILTKYGGKKFGTQQSISLRSLPNESTRFDELVKDNYDRVLEKLRESFPGATPFDYVRIETHERPRFVIGFFRHTTSAGANAFTPEELQRFEHLRPHIILLFRTVLNHDLLSQPFQYFQNFSTIGSQLAERFKFSDAEVRLLPDILFGYSNEEIARRHYVSVATVKSHVQHILKKADSKSKIEFIGKYFTSPEGVRM